MENQSQALDLNLETQRYHLISYRNGYKLFLYDNSLLKRVNDVTQAYPLDTKFKRGEEAIFAISSNLLEPVARALGIKDLGVLKACK